MVADFGKIIYHFSRSSHNKVGLFSDNLYFVPTAKILEEFVKSTFIDNVLPWWVDVITDPVKFISGYFLMIVLVTLIFTLIDWNKAEEEQKNINSSDDYNL